MPSNTINFQASPHYHQSYTVKTIHGMFSRNNGVSHSPYTSLNISYNVGDDPAHVTTNRRKVKEALGIRFLVSSHQVHANKIHSVESVYEDTELDGYDALISNTPGVGLLIQQADCQAILLHDPGKRVVAAIHCGWRGSVSNIIKSTIACMGEKYRTEPESLRAVISPSLGPCCAEFIHYRTELPKQFHRFQPTPNYFNFWEISRFQLLEAGLTGENIDCANICTSCNKDFFSYRRSRKKGKHLTGRNCSVICLTSP